MLYRWRRLDDDDRLRVWRLYGWFCFLMLCGSCFGAVTWAARMISLINGFKANDPQFGDRAQSFWLQGLGRTWRAVFSVTYAIEFLCLSAALLMVLDRMSDFAAPQGDGMRKWWVAGGRIVMAVVVLGNAVGLAANIAAAVHFQKSSEAWSSASAYVAANNSRVASEHILTARSENQLAGFIASVQSFCEVAVLLLIVIAFLVAGVICARRISSALSVLGDAGAEMAAGMRMRQHVVGAAVALGKQMRHEIVLTTCFVCLAFVLRAADSTMLALAFRFQNTANRHPGVISSCDASCYNVFARIALWSSHTPEFQTTVVLISSPLALLVALWGMTTKLTLQLMKSSQRETVPLRTLQQPGSALS